MILSRFLFSIAALFSVMLGTFILLRLYPGGPFDDEVNFSPAVRARLTNQYALEKPLLQQTQVYLLNLVSGSWGYSYLYNGKSVKSLILNALPRTLFLGGFSLALAALAGLGLGFLYFLTDSERIVRILHRFFLSAPTLFLGPLLILVFGIWLHLLPISVDERGLSYALPIVVLAVRPTANLARLLISAQEQALREPWVLTAQAMGLSPRLIVMKYALRESLIPLLSYLGPALAGVFSGSLIVENIFNIQGLGTLFLQSLINRDYQLITTLTVLYAAVLILSNFLLDVLSSLVDPRLRGKEI